MMKDCVGLWVPREILMRKGFTQTEKLLISAIWNLSKNQECCAGNQYFAELLGIGKHQVSLIIGKLKNSGIVESRVVYKKNSKEIQARLLKVCFEKLFADDKADLCTRSDRGYGAAVTLPMSLDVKDRINNYKKIYINSSSQIFVGDPAGQVRAQENVQN